MKAMPTLLAPTPLVLVPATMEPRDLSLLSFRVGPQTKNVNVSVFSARLSTVVCVQSEKRGNIHTEKSVGHPLSEL